VTEDRTRETLVKYLADAHAMEVQALVQLRVAPKVAGSPGLERIFREHEAETEDHERLVSERLRAYDAAPSVLKDLVMRAGGGMFAAFASLSPDTPGKLTAHAYAYEHLELASYELLRRVAQRLDDAETADVARRIGEQEQAMAERLEQRFDEAAEAAIQAAADDLDDRLDGYLADAHALEEQAIALLQHGRKVVGASELTAAMDAHLAETREHERLVRERLQARGGRPSRVKDAAMRSAGLNWGAFFEAHPDTPGKLTAFAYAFEHLEIGGYEQLQRVAQRAGDQETVAAAQRILAEERAAAEKLAAHFDRAVEASLQAQGVTA
jgi:ferritin-like metal-binding protein YciE